MKNKIKLDDKVTLRTDIAIRLPYSVTKGTVFIVDLIEGGRARISDDKISFVVPLEALQKAGESTDEIKIIRKLEDLDNFFSEDKKTLCKYYYDKFHERDVLYVYDTKRSKDLSNDLWEIFTIYGLDKYSLNKLEFAGINAEYKPLRTVEEVLEEMKSKTDDVLKERNYDLYEVNFIKLTKRYKIRMAETVGAPVFVAGLAQKYADELNEILGTTK